MPELPEVEAVRRHLEPVMRGARFTDVVLNRPNLRRFFPADFVTRLVEQSVRAVDRRGKYLLADLSSGETLLIHLGMSGSFIIELGGKRTAAPATYQLVPDDRRHDHVVFRMSSGATIAFNDPRRFGVMDLIGRDARSAYPPLRGLGPEPLGAAFDPAALARACARRSIPLKVALLDQKIVAGVGNIYASEALNLARLSPLRRASSIATKTGQPRESARRLAAAIKKVLVRAIERASRPTARSARFRVYDREGEPCPTKHCRGTIRRIWQSGRSTFYCPVCQR